VESSLSAASDQTGARFAVVEAVAQILPNIVG
jgi:hypothetical protein